MKIPSNSSRKRRAMLAFATAPWNLPKHRLRDCNAKTYWSWPYLVIRRALRCGAGVRWGKYGHRNFITIFVPSKTVVVVVSSVEWRTYVTLIRDLGFQIELNPPDTPAAFPWLSVFWKKVPSKADGLSLIAKLHATFGQGSAPRGTPWKPVPRATSEQEGAA